MRYEEDIWNLTGDEDLTLWPHQIQKWYKTKRGWFLTTEEIYGNHKWYSTARMAPDDATPDWNPWNRTFPEDIILELPNSEFSEEEIFRGNLQDSGIYRKLTGFLLRRK